MWWWTEVARAGACCVGATSGLPLRVGECERVVAGVGLAAEAAVLRWDAGGAVRGAAPVEEAGQLMVGAGARWARWGQGFVSLPARVSRRAVDGLTDSGVGVGDLRAAVVLDPLEERPDGPPVPVATLGVRAPTGRDWTEADGALLADVTGLPGVGASAALTLEHVTGRGPWWVGADGGYDPGTPARAGLSAAWGRYLGATSSVVATARHERQLAAGGTARTQLGGRWVVGRPIRWRAWAGLATDVPVPGLGHDLPMTTTLDVGWVWIR